MEKKLVLMLMKKQSLKLFNETLSSLPFVFLKNSTEKLFDLITLADKNTEGSRADIMEIDHV